MKALVSQSAYARRRGVKRQSVAAAIASGRISTVNGKIDPEIADREWDANTDLSAPRNATIGDPQIERPAGLPMDLDGNGKKTAYEASSYLEARIRRERCQAEAAQLEVDRKKGLLVSKDEVRRAAFETARKARDSLMALPERISIVLAAAGGPAEIQRLLESEIERICIEIADEYDRKRR